jgi:hypothetical protein
VGRIGNPSVNIVATSSRMGIKEAGKEDKEDSVTSTTTMSTHKWGQHHCGESCACVLRLDVTVDPSEDGIVTAARYTARSILRSSATGRPYVSPRLSAAALRSTSSSNSSSSNSTTTTKTNQKLFLTECTCPNLHRLAQKTCAYQLHKNMFQIMNNLYTSPPIKHYIARTHRLTQSPHCYDLVHATLHALWYQRLPPRPHMSATTTLFSSEPDYNIHHHPDHPYPDATTTTMANYFYETVAATPERSSGSPWWWISSNSNNDENSDRTAAAGQRSSSSTDYYIRETLQQHLDRLDDNALNGASGGGGIIGHPAAPGQRSTTNSPLSSRHKDWVAYVDEMQDSNDARAMEYHRRWSKSA